MRRGEERGERADISTTETHLELLSFHQIRRVRKQNSEKLSRADTWTDSGYLD